MNDRLRGIKDARQAIPLLQERWPSAFPKKSHLVRPLASSVVAHVAEQMGWSRQYTRGVLSFWKVRDGYCHAILHAQRRVDVDGAETAEAVEDQARGLARAQLARNAARRLKAAARVERPPSAAA